jgi:hypothetical protein
VLESKHPEENLGQTVFIPRLWGLLFVPCLENKYRILYLFYCLYILVFIYIYIYTPPWIVPNSLLCIFMFFFNRMKITQLNHITIFALLLIVSFQGLLCVG